MKEYHKIDGVYKRDEYSKKVIPVYRNEEFALLKDALWYFSEKIDGTNIRVHWDGHQVEFAGRTDKAQIPNDLLEYLKKTFGGLVNEEIFEQNFGGKDVILYGEGYGPKIQAGGNYRDNVSFILFDVQIDDIFLKRDDVEAISRKFDIDYAYTIFVGTLQQGIDYIKGHPKSLIAKNKDYYMEGIVGRPVVELRDRLGRRIITKIKWEDIKDLVEGEINNETNSSL